MYIYEHPDWPHFTWDLERIFLPLTEAVHLHGVLAGRMEALTLESRQEANLLFTAHTVVSSCAIEGEVLDLCGQSLGWTAALRSLCSRAPR